MLLRLALGLGKTLREVITGTPGPMTPGEFMVWSEFYDVDPWGEQRADLRLALIMAAAKGILTGEAANPKDLLLFPDGPTTRKLSPDEVMAKMTEWAHAGRKPV